MSDEITQAIQVIRVGFEGINIAIKVGSGGLNAVKNLAKVLQYLLIHEKTMGKTSLKKMLKAGGDLQVLSFEEKELEKVKKLAKKYGILYSVLPDINKGDNMKEIVFPTEATPRINMLLQKLNEAKIKTMDEYISNGTSEGFKELDETLAKSEDKSTPSEELTAEKKEEYKKMVDRIRKIEAAEEDTTYTEMDIDMSKKIDIDKATEVATADVPKPVDAHANELTETVKPPSKGAR